MDLPDDLRESLTEGDFATVSAWWQSLTPEQQAEITEADDSKFASFSQLQSADDAKPEEAFAPFVEYLTNHELRIVNFVADEQAKSAHRIVSSYIASLGSDYRHGRPGTVR